MIDTHHIPLAAIDEVAVRQVMAVAPTRSATSRRPSGTPSCAPCGRGRSAAAIATFTYQEYVRDRVLDLADGARQRLAAPSRPPPTRVWAVPEIAGLVITAVGLVVTIALG